MSKKEEMSAHLAAWKESGLTQKAYCELHSIKVPTFSYWVTKFRGKKNIDLPAQFIPFSLSNPVEQKITVEYPNGVKVNTS
ncbi:IS66 family insertion sequence hypothetical protein (plasmid) [Flammeovirga pectinis]|uniref:IS66 family insertion sequence element accessory protein TnpB n=1 Tax=Flammeovirga pectinis TaxID=2494373 RepID=A0A3Q9FUW8_9BACT|nr:hypothetical protein [Flammeovirga pectinis]AZQ65651.1 IS66 family insertion sequence hypothetical protein [Flammeovirga pectinis]